ncbi:AbrB/MazE/SpoVT family DNA-binding domain-containing protein [Sphingomonas silueang]|jgi:AbrB family looped-hinge helix DNA binding protein|uniref:AbrB/MazE/SpoVT family DNA-binding domain-containing protein n=1 Tax=Sphingomonas silueang TaxID=3156617 RepID=UPI0032B572B0
MNALSAKLTEGGRLVVPAALRKELGVEPGDQVFMEVVDGQLHVWSQKQAIARAQAQLHQLTGGKRSLVDELLAERRAEADRDGHDA